MNQFLAVFFAGEDQDVTNHCKMRAFGLTGEIVILGGDDRVLEACALVCILILSLNINLRNTKHWNASYPVQETIVRVPID